MKNINVEKKRRAGSIISTILIVLMFAGCIGVLSWSLTGIKKNDNLMAQQKKQMMLDNERMKQEIIKETKDNLIKEIKDKKLVEIVEVQDKVADEMIEKKLQEKSLVGKKYSYDTSANTIEVDLKNNEAVLCEFEHSVRKSYSYLKKGASTVTFVSYMLDPGPELHTATYDVTWNGTKAILTKKDVGFYDIDSTFKYHDRLNSEYAKAYGITAVYF